MTCLNDVVMVVTVVVEKGEWGGGELREGGWRFRVTCGGLV